MGAGLYLALGPRMIGCHHQVWKRAVRALVSTLALFAAIGSGSATSVTATVDDYQAVFSAWKEAAGLRNDVMEASAPSFAAHSLDYFCLSPLIEQLSELEADLRVGYKMIAILEMSTTDDIRVVSSMDVTSALSGAVQWLPNLRTTANKAAGVCRTSAVVNAKAQAVIELTRDVEAKVGPIARRLNR